MIWIFFRTLLFLLAKKLDIAVEDDTEKDLKH